MCRDLPYTCESLRFKSSESLGLFVYEVITPLPILVACN